MSILTFINLISNAIIGTSIMLFIISVFGRADHPIWENKYRAYLAKVGLGISGCGALLNILSLSTPNITEIVLNIGLSLNFCWLSWWQYAESKRKKTTVSVLPTMAPLNIASLTAIPVPVLKVPVQVKTTPLVKEVVPQAIPVFKSVPKPVLVEKKEEDKPEPKKGGRPRKKKV